MRPASMLVGLSATAALTLAGSTSAFAATGLADGTITLGSTTCSWVNATTSDTPPNTLTIDHTTVHVTCSDGSSVSLTNNPTISFNDAAGTALVNEVDVTAVVSGISCSYKATNLGLTRSGTTRTYSGGPYTASRTGGSFLCPSSESIDSATVAFH